MANAFSKLPDILRHLFGTKKVNLAKNEKKEQESLIANSL